jgi:DNA recombination protein RmuC
MLEWSIVAGVLVLMALLVLSAVALARLGSLRRDREADAHEAAALRARVEALTQAAAQHERDMRADLAVARREQAEAAAVLRREVGERLGQFQQVTQQALAALTAAQSEQLQAFGERLTQFTQTTQSQLGLGAAAQAEQARLTAERLGALTRATDERLEAIRNTVEQRLDALRRENAEKLEKVRETVDEKLQATLDQRLGDSFKLVSDRLEQVHKGLGEMQSLAVGVGDLKRVLTNVKTRGGWGEVQLGSLLDELLTPQQYDRNVITRRGSTERVEYAIRLPGKGDDNQPCWLPIDCKFPLEDWQRLQDALERADVPAADAARKALADFLRSQARMIRDKYVDPPHTTDFAILFLPTEGLYAEMMARPGFADTLQRELRVLVTGPMNLAALLNSLQMGFRTLAIEQRSSEVWRTLGAVKTEFAKFGQVLAKTKERIDRASEELERAGVRRRVLERHLRNVDALPEPDAARIIGPTFNLELDGPPEEK